MKSGIFEVQRRGNLADSDPRLQLKRLIFQGVRELKVRNVSRNVSRFHRPVKVNPLCRHRTLTAH